MEKWIVEISGQKKNVEKAIFSGFQHHSQVINKSGYSQVIFICEEDNTINDIMDCVNLREVELWNCSIKSIYMG